MLKDLGIDYVQSDVESAYLFGPINDKAVRPCSIKVQFASYSEYNILTNIQKLKGKKQWRGIYILDAISMEEQEKRRDMRCIFAAGKVKGIDIKLRGSNIVFDGIEYSHNDFFTLPKGLSIEEIKIVETKDGPTVHILVILKGCYYY